MATTSPAPWPYATATGATVEITTMEWTDFLTGARLGEFGPAV
ncbi:hypothetical protein ACFU7T_37585 [Streptomyces sp. NPDC057555]